MSPFDLPAAEQPSGKDETITLRAIVDRTILEVFFNDGLVSSTFSNDGVPAKLKVSLRTTQGGACDNYTVKWVHIWTPGAVFHRIGAECKAFVDHIRYRPWEVLLKSRIRYPLDEFIAPLTQPSRNQEPNHNALPKP